MRSGIDSLVSALCEGLRRGGRGEVPDFEEFYERIFSWKLPRFQKILLPALESEHEILILAPPGHAKTTLLLAWCAYRLGLEPNLRVMVATHTASYSEQLLAAIETILRSREFVSIFGEVCPPLGTGKWTTTQKFLLRTDLRIKDPSLLAIGVGSSTIGNRADLIIADDLVTQANSLTPTLRSHLSDWFWGSLRKRLEPEGQIIVTGARFYAQDLYSELLNSFKSFVFRTSPEKVLWPERYGKAEIEKARQQNYFSYLSQYQQQPVDLEAGFLKEGWLSYYIEEPKDLKIYQGIDPCLKRKGDYFCLVTIGLDRAETAYVLDLIRLQADFEEQKRLILSQYERWQPFLMMIEVNAAQTFLAETLLARRALPLQRVVNEFPKHVRFTTMATHFKNNKVLLPGNLLPNGRLAPKDCVRALVEEWRNYPRGTTDTLDALELALRGAFSFRVAAASEFQPEERGLSYRERETLFSKEFTPLFH